MTTPYDRLIYNLFANQHELIPIAKRLMGVNAPDTLFKFNEPASEVLRCLFNGKDTRKLSQAAGQYFQKLNRDNPDLGKWPTPEYLVELVNDVRGYYINRRFQELANELRTKTGDEILLELAKFRNEVNQLTDISNGLISFDELIEDTVAMYDNFADGQTSQDFLPYAINGYDRPNPLDDFVGGMPRGELVIIGGSTGVGKSAFALKVAMSNAYRITRQEIKSGIYIASGEMPAKLWLQRAGSVASGVNINKGIKGQWTRENEDYKRIKQATLDLHGYPIRVSQKSRLTVSHLKSNMEMMVDTLGGCDLVIVDFARLFKPDNTETRGETERVEALFYDFEALANDFVNPDGTQAVIMALSEVTKDAPAWLGEDDLKYSGHYAAAQILTLIDVHKHLKDRKIKNLMRDNAISEININYGDMWLNVAKNRYGETGLVTGLQFLRGNTDWSSKPIGKLLDLSEIEI